jgi:hypothetical protein
MNDMTAPRLTREGFRIGCSQPGPTRDMMKTVSLGKTDITFTNGGSIIISTDDPFLLKQLSDAKSAVGDRTTRIKRKS